MVQEIREAAGFEGLIVLAVIYLVLNLISKAGKKTPPGAHRPTASPPPTASTENPEGFSLQTILREIERVKREKASAGARRPSPAPRPLPSSAAAKPKPLSKYRPPSAPERGKLATSDRGPLGRHGGAALPSDEDIEERESLDERGFREAPESSEVMRASRSRTERPDVDEEAEVEATVQRRLAEAEGRGRPHSEADHRAFHQRLVQGDQPTGSTARYSMDRLRQAIIWREILGPPKGLTDL